jgi:hypothetical protein
MTFTVSGSTITQSGTDTSFAGLNGLSGVTRLATGDGFLYYMPTISLVVTGSLTIADPSKDTIICNKLSISSTGNYWSGSWAADGVTPLRGGRHFQVVGGGQMAGSFGGNSSLEIATGGQFTTIGGFYEVAGGTFYQADAIIREYYTKVVATRAWGTGSARVRAFSSNVIKRFCEHYDYAYDLFVMPIEYSVKAFSSEYVAQYVGGIAGGIHAKFTSSALSNVDGTYDFDNFGSGWIELYNCAKGANLNVVTQNVGASVIHCVPLFQDINLFVTNLAGVPQENVRFRCVDAPVSNSPTTTITTSGSLKTWDFRNPQTYTGVTNASGAASLSPVLQVWHGTSNLKNLRFPSSTATIRLFGYAVRQQEVQVVLGSDTAINRAVAMVAATNLTLTEVQAGAITGITFAASGASGGTVTVTGSLTVAQIWHAWRFWKGQIANASSEDTWEFDGSTLNMAAWNLANAGSITGNLSTTGTVSNTGLILGVYTSSAGTSSIIQLTASAGSSIYSGSNSTGATKVFQAAVAGGTTNIYFAPGENAPQRVVREIYGFQRAEQIITPSGGVFTFNPVDVPDVGISQATQATVAAYSEVETADKFYDRTALFRLTEAGIKLGQIATRDGSDVRVEGYNMVINQSAASVYAVSGSTITLKATGYSNGTKYTNTVLDNTKTLTANTNEVLSADFEDANGDSAVTIVGGDGAFELWKVPTSTATADYATGVKLADVINERFRFSSAAGFDLVGLDINSNVRRRTSMAKGVYWQEFYVGAQIQLAQAPIIDQINTKVDLLAVELEQKAETAATMAALGVINQGVKAASLLIPHATDV